jgi:cytochrome c2
MRNILSWFSIALILAASAHAGPVGDAAKKGDTAEIERLMKSGADANEEDAMASPLHWAAMNGHVEAVALLVAYGAALDAQSDMLGSPLHAAAGFGRAGTLQRLLMAGADIEARNREDFTPLITAIIKNKPDAAAALLAAGADPNAVSIGKSPVFGSGPLGPLQVAIDTGQDEIAAMLRQAGAGPMPPSVPENLAQMGDGARGRDLAYTYCKQCHTIAAGDELQVGHLRSGPPLIGVFGRPVADLSGFEYSRDLQDFGGTWSAERLYAFVLTPMLTVPGTRMNWAPDRTPEMIADIVAYFISEAN